jgi:hypothetical protein
MSPNSSERLVCSSCGSAYPLEAVRDHASFSCSICGNVIVVPSSVPGAPPVQRAAPAPSVRTPAARAPARPAHRSPASPPRGHHAHDKRRTAKRDGGKPVVILSCIGLLVVGVGAVMALQSGDADTPDSNDTTGPTAPVVSTADPKTDPDAWKALSSTDRARLRRETLDAVDRHNSSQLQWAALFFAERGELDARKTVARWAVETDPGARWAHEILGLDDCGKLVDALFEESPRAEELQTEAVRDLEALVSKARPGSGPWFPPIEVATQVRELVHQVRADEARLQDDYWFGVTRWTNYQRTVEVMRDYPALTDTAGPYVIFVQVGGKPKEDLSDADAVELNRAQRVMRETKALFASLYAGWHRELGGLFGFTRYGPDNATFETLLKVNAFSREEDFERYCRERHSWSPTLAGVRAFYVQEEPRFIVTHDGDAEGEEPFETYQTQCHEGVHQLVHFYTRELTEKSTGKPPAWQDCATRPLWSSEGFAEFFSAFRGDGEKRMWMQPLDSRMELIWIVDQAFPKLGWKDYPLARLTSVSHGGGLDEAILRTAPRLTEAQAKDDRWKAWHSRIQSVYANLYYARAWSFVYFLWNAESGGRPKYRERYIAYLKREFVVPSSTDKLAEDGRWTSKLLLDALGITNMDDLKALESEWRTWVGDLCEQYQHSDWLPTRHALFKLMGVKK